MTSRVDLWCWHLDPPADVLLRYWATLPADEQGRADRFHFEKHRRRFIAAHGRLREILGARLGMAPAALRFDTGAEGKPFLPGHPLHFNLSHSDERALFGVRMDGPLGVDIECVRPVGEDLTVFSFAPREIAEILALPPDRRLEAFFLGWTRKEAYIKATSRGFAIPLASFDVSVTPDAPAVITRIAGDDPAAWRLCHLVPAPGYIGAVAARTTILDFTIHPA